MTSCPMSKKAIFFLLILYCMFPALIACGRSSSEKAAPFAVKGVIDLKGWDFKRDGSINLDGQWHFCWDTAREPSGNSSKENRKDCGFISVPGLWKNHGLNGTPLPGNGHAAYHLKIKNLEDKKIKTLTVHCIYSSYELWINGIRTDKKGITDSPLKNREDYIYIHNKRLSSFTPVDGVNKIVLYIFNDEYESGGIARPLVLEDGEAAAGREFLRYKIDMIIVGLLLFAAVYNILFYFFRKKDKTPLYIGFASLVWTINTYNILSPILSGSFSPTGNPFLINYITVILGMTLLMMLIKSLFPYDFSTYVLRFCQIIGAVLIVMFFFVGFRTSEKIMYVYFVLCSPIFFYGIYVLVKTIKNHREDAILFSLGFLTLFIGGINNVLFAFWIISTGNVIHYAMVALCFTSTIVISRRFSRALRMVENLSKDLEYKNISLMKLDRIKDQFLANISHELRTPLHGMIGLSESMIEGSGRSLQPKMLENLSYIASSGHRLANLVNDLLDMAKIQDEGLNLNLKPVDIFSLIDMVIKLSIPLALGKPLKIINSVKPDIPRVHADEDRIRQVMHNLIGNAIKFTNKGTIEISAREILYKNEDADAGACPVVEICVLDTGIGIPEEYKENIFEAYRQVDGGDRRSYPGTGLGLAISKQIIEQHEGSIWMEPGREGGAAFFFTLPVSKDPLPYTSDVIIESMDDSLHVDENQGMRSFTPGIDQEDFSGNPALLIVDDDPVNIRTLQNYFETKKCIIKTASDGLNALEIIERDKSIDLVLLDIMMPVMSGYDVCRKIRTKHTPEELPVIMLTAKNMMSDIDAAFEAGANDYIVKPFRISELLARVGTMLRLRSIRKSTAEGITIRGKNRIYSLTFRDILYISSHIKNIVIHTIKEDIEVPVLLKELIDRLPPDIFVRIHKSHIININYIHSLIHVLSGRYRVRLRDEDDTELPVGPAFLESLRKKI